jgi:intein-encoded DNA endonuclease-like protein
MTIKKKAIELISNEHYNLLINQKRDLKYEIKKLKATIKRKDEKIKKFEYVERDNRILRDKIKMLELEHERI